MAVKKTATFRIYDITGTYIGNITNATFDSFRKVMNGGLGDLNITLAMGFAECYTSAYTVPGNRVEMVVVDAETPASGTVMYSGFILTRSPQISGDKEKVVLTCRGHAAKFPFLPLKNGTTTVLRTDTTNGLTTGATASAATLDKIFKAIIDRYRAETLYPAINYSSGSIDAFTETLTYTFKTKNLTFPINQVNKNAPVGTYWRVGADNIVYFNKRSTTPDHILTLGAHFEEITDNETLDGMINREHFSYNGSPPGSAKLFSNAASAAQYGDWWDWHVDGRYTVLAEVTRVANATLDANSIPPRRTVVKVPDSNGDRLLGYDIEKFEPGQTVRIMNLPTGAQLNFPSMFQIAAMDYALGYALLELNTPLDDLAREVARIEAEGQEDVTENVPTSYTT